MPALDLAARLWAEHLRRVRSEAARTGNRKRWAAKRERERQALIEAHLELVRKVARQVHRTLFTVPVDDLVQAGCLGLAEAAARYVPGQGDFSHFCYFRIRGAMIDANRRNAYREGQHTSVDEWLARSADHDEHRREGRYLRDRSALPDEISIDRERRDLVRAAVEELPDEQRAVMRAHLAERDLAGVARSCGRSAAWVRARLKLAQQAVIEQVRLWTAERAA